MAETEKLPRLVFVNPSYVRRVARRSSRVLPAGTCISISVPPVNSMLNFGPYTTNRTADASTRRFESERKNVETVRKVIAEESNGFRAFWPLSFLPHSG